jgi:hypothetical protein
MSEVMSFGNIVNSLRSVRDDYNENLKSVPQYEAFLLVESSTLKVADTLQGVVNSGVPSMAAEVIAALETAKTKFREHLTSVPEYRALLAIDKLIRDVSADLGIRVDTQSPPEAQIEQASTGANTTSPPEPAAQPPAELASVSQLEITEPIAVRQGAGMQPVASAQVPQHGDAIAKDASAERASADAISQVHFALQQPAEHRDTISENPDVAEHAPSEPGALSSQIPAQESDSLVQPEPGPMELETEKAA